MLETIYNEQEPVAPVRFEPDYSDNRSILLDGMENTKLNSTVRH